MEKTAFAGFWIRLVAYAVDLLFVSLAGWILGFLLGFAYVSVVGDSAYVDRIGDVFGILITWLYFAGFESSKYQATFGKRIVGISVTDAAGSRISFGRATARHFAKLISLIPLGIGFIMIAFDKQKRGLHDRIARTLVVHTS